MTKSGMTALALIAMTAMVAGVGGTGRGHLLHLPERQGVMPDQTYLYRASFWHDEDRAMDGQASRATGPNVSQHLDSFGHQLV